VKLLNQHNPDSETLLHSILFFLVKKATGESFFYDSEKKRKVRGVYWKAGLAQIVKP
jgi:hypothetical protein